MNIKVQPCKNNIGAEISCSLKTASKEEINKIKEALNEFGGVFFRNQNLDSESNIKFAGRSKDFELTQKGCMPCKY